MRTSGDSFMQDIPALWDRFFAECKPDRSKTIYCVYTRYDSDHTGGYTCFIGQDATAMMFPEQLLIRPGKYAQFMAVGDLGKGTVLQTWKEVWAAEERLGRAYTTDYEVYEPDRTSDMTNAVVDIFVAVN